MNSQEWAREKIRYAGLRATPARIATLKVLHGSGSPLTHAEVSDKLENLEIDKATIFRNLTDLVARNVIRRSALCDNVWRFEIIIESAH